MIDNSLVRVRQQIENIWQGSGAGSDYIQAMRQVLPGLNQKAAASQDTVRWINLPYLCCQAAGGDPHWADSLAAAWYLLLTAAHLMDKVEDQDKPDPSWALQGPGGALAAATGLFFTASLALQGLYKQPETRGAAADVISDFYAGFLRMSSGQQADLIYPEPTLEQYWEIARDKSGEFFQIACRCGARLAGASPDCLEGLSTFGMNLGILKQILDDLDDIRLPVSAHPMRAWPEIARSLPVVYAREVLPAKEGARLRHCLQNVPHHPEAAQEAFQILEHSGAALYLNLKMNYHREQAIAAVQGAAAGSTALQPLLSYLEQTGTPGDPTTQA